MKIGKVVIRLRKIDDGFECDECGKLIKGRIYVPLHLGMSRDGDWWVCFSCYLSYWRQQLRKT